MPKAAPSNRHAIATIPLDELVADWFHRRSETLADTRALIGVALGCGNPFDFLRAQQRFAASACMRWVEDVDTLQAISQRVASGALSWPSAEGETPAARTAAETRAAAKPLREADAS
jgi:hypothetical protein